MKIKTLMYNNNIEFNLFRKNSMETYRFILNVYYFNEIKYFKTF